MDFIEVRDTFYPSCIFNAYFQPSDCVRYSFPLSYLFIDALSTNGKSDLIQFYPHSCAHFLLFCHHPFFLPRSMGNNAPDVKIFMMDVGVRGYVFILFFASVIFSIQPCHQPRESCQHNVRCPSCIVVRQRVDSAIPPGPVAGLSVNDG